MDWGAQWAVRLPENSRALSGRPVKMRAARLGGGRPRSIMNPYRSFLMRERSGSSTRILTPDDLIEILNPGDLSGIQENLTGNSTGAQERGAGTSHQCRPIAGRERGAITRSQCGPTSRRPGNSAAGAPRQFGSNPSPPRLTPPDIGDPPTVPPLGPLDLGDPPTVPPLTPPDLGDPPTVPKLTPPSTGQPATMPRGTPRGSSSSAPRGGAGR